VKKVISFIVVLTLLFSIPGISLAAESQSASTFKAAVDSQTILRFFVGKTIYYVNGSQRTLDVAPFIRENRTHLPIRFVAESLGATVSWDQVKKEVTIVLNGTTIKLWIGQSTAQVNGSSVPIDSSNPQVTPIIVQSRTFIPIRFVLEALNSEVIWDSADYSITVKYPRLTTSATMLTYENPTYGFRINYPQGWTGQQGQVMGLDAFVFSSPGGTSVSVVIENLPYPMTLDEYVSSGITVLKQAFPDINFIESSATTLAGLPAHRLEYTCTVEGRTFKRMQTAVIKGSKAYIVTYEAEISIFPNDLGTAQDMINSFAFI
jgi:hypothetical protein